MTLVADIGPVIDRFPVLITQHMPPTFTTILIPASGAYEPTGRRMKHVDGEIVKASQIS